MNIVELKNSLNTKLRFNGNSIVLSVTNSLDINDTIYYACYLFAKNSLILKMNYQKSGVFEFDLKKSGFYSLKVYILNKKDNMRASKSIDLGLLVCETEYFKYKLADYLSKNNKVGGEVFFKDRVLSFSNFSHYEFLDIDAIYYSDPFNNRTWRWKLLQLQYLTTLIAYYSEVKLNEVLTEIFKLLVLFNEYIESSASLYDDILWQDHVTAIRLKYLSFIFKYFLINNLIKLDDSIYTILVSLIKLHVDKLKNDSFYSKNTNHGFDQSLFLYQASIELEYILDLSDVIVIAENRIIDEINFAFCQDGGHKENSPGYLNFGIKQCLEFINISNKYNLESEGVENVKIIINKATNVLTYLVKPNGFLPLIGDTPLFKVADIFKNYKPDCYPNFKYSITQGKIGKKPLTNSLVLESSGYAVYRSDWNKDNFEESIYLTCKAGYVSNYHRHDDDLSVTLYAHGEDWLVDGSTYKYDEKNIHRRYIRSHRSHNLLSPQGVPASRDKNRKHFVAIKSNNALNINPFDVIATTKMFQNFDVTRNIVVDSAKIIKIHDTCKTDLNEQFKIVSRFFIDENKEIKIVENKIYIKGKNKTLVIEVESVSKIEINFVNSNQDQVVGWLSKKINQLYKANLIEIKSIDQSLSFNMTTTAYFL